MKKEKNTTEEELQTEFDELKSLLQRTQADFVNYRRRNEEEKAIFVRLAASDLMEQLLPVLDNFALAAQHVPEEIKDNSWVRGIRVIEKQLEQILLTNGLEKVTTIGEQFDPNIHEAVGESREKGVKADEITGEQSPGYLLGGKLIRPAKVIVNKKGF